MKNKIFNLLCNTYFVSILATILVLIFFFDLSPININVFIGEFSHDKIANFYQIKAILQGNWQFYDVIRTDKLSAPFLHENFDYKQPVFFFWLLIKLIGFFSKNHFVVFNVFIILTFILTTISMVFLLKKLRIDKSIIIIIALLYTFLPFHFYRINHLSYLGYFFVPIYAYILLLMWNRKPIFFKRIVGDHKYYFDFSKQNIILIVLLFFSATYNFYYSFFFCYLIIIVSVSSFFYHKNRYHIYTAISILGIILIPFLINLLPYFYYINLYGTNEFIANRHFTESEIYGLKIIQMLLPTVGHRLESFSNIITNYNIHAPLVNENSTATLGLWGSIGFILLIINLLKINSKNDIYNRLTLLVIFSILLATIGGFSTLFAILISPEIRGYNRISIFIATFSLLAFAFLLKYIISRYFYKKISKLFIITIVILVGLLDQITPNIPFYQTRINDFLEDKVFYQMIEQHYDNKITKIYQLPYMSFPEHAPINGLHGYDPLKGYLFTNNIQWSYGAIRGREADKWNKSLQSLSVQELLERLVFTDFKGIVVYKSGYKDQANNIIRQLTNILGNSKFISQDKVFYDLTDFAKTIESRLSKEKLTEKQFQAKYPIYISFNNFHVVEKNKVSEWRWSSSNKASINFFNSTNRTRNIIIKMQLATGYNKKSLMQINYNSKSKRYDINNQFYQIETAMTLKQGNNIIEFNSNTTPVDAPKDPRLMYFRVNNLKYIENYSDQQK